MNFSPSTRRGLQDAGGVGAEPVDAPADHSPTAVGGRGSASTGTRCPNAVRDGHILTTKKGFPSVRLVSWTAWESDVAVPRPSASPGHRIGGRVRRAGYGGGRLPSDSDNSASGTRRQRCARSAA